MRERFLLELNGMQAASVAELVFAGSIKQAPAQPQVKMPAAVSDSLDAEVHRHVEQSAVLHVWSRKPVLRAAGRGSAGLTEDP
jgi:hypothetical protein